MYVAKIPNRNSPPSYLVRESYRKDGKVHNRTVANITALPPTAIEAVRHVLSGTALAPIDEIFTIIEDGSQSHGHVAAICKAMKQLDFANLLASRRCRERDLIVAMVAARIIEPHSKLETTRWWHTTTIPNEFGVADANEDDLYKAMDWLLNRQDAIEKKLAHRHLTDGGIALYDLTSSYF